MYPVERRKSTDGVELFLDAGDSSVQQQAAKVDEVAVKKIPVQENGQSKSIRTFATVIWLSVIPCVFKMGEIFGKNELGVRAKLYSDNTVTHVLMGVTLIIYATIMFGGAIFIQKARF